VQRLFHRTIALARNKYSVTEVKILDQALKLRSIGQVGIEGLVATFIITENS